ncbi:major facilitator superfamily domain-containing protein [Mrakia frigida]|uniref:major facilitator superfamily domain-containing protein n=1 Tax=Mrakia frigida TaxID=29902 RepID=UPI003FCBFEB3
MSSDPSPSIEAPRNARDRSSSPPAVPAQEQGPESAVYASRYSNTRRYSLLALFCFAQFIDIFLASGIVIGVPAIAKDLDMTISESIWVVNAYALTASSFFLAAFLLTGGRISDVTSARPVFIVGLLWVGVFCVGLGFVQTKVAMFVLRAFSGVGASITIPAALRLIVWVFPNDQQTMAISVFGGAAAITKSANVLNPLYLWSVFYSEVYFFWPVGSGSSDSQYWDGEDSAETLVTLLLGLALFPVLFYWQTRIDPIDALIKPRTWFLPNFFLISIMALTPYFWFYQVQLSFSEIFQTVWGNSAILTAAKFLPMGIVALVTVIGSAAIPPTVFNLRWRLVSGSIVSAGGVLILSFAYNEEDYWRLCFPGFVVGSIGAALLYVSVNVAMMLAVPREESGIAAGIFNTLAQLGAALFLALSTTIQTSFPLAPDSPTPSARGYRYAFYFTMSLMLFVGLIALIFFVDPSELERPEEDRVEIGTNEKRAENFVGGEVAHSTGEI